MKSGMDFTGFEKICVAGSESRSFVSFAENLGMKNVLSERADVVVVTDRKFVPDLSNKKVAFPYFEGFKKSEIECKRIMTYAVEKNEADVVGKNVRFTDDFTAFELLTEDGIGRIYLNSRERNAPRYAIALACGLMLSGIPFGDVPAMISFK